MRDELGCLSPQRYELLTFGLGGQGDPSQPRTVWIGPIRIYLRLCLRVGSLSLDKNTGELVGEDGSGASASALHAAWSSLTYGKIAGKETLIWGGTDGFCYGYPNKTEKDADGYDLFMPSWKVDCNEPNYRIDKDGKKSLTQRLPAPASSLEPPFYTRKKFRCDRARIPSTVTVLVA